jgi:hypothetical protein
LAITALLRVMNAAAMAGRRCMVSTLLGQKPSVSLKKAARASTWGSVPGASGATRGISGP